MYLCYDLKGIQSFIFQIPRLKYIVGGSALIDIFDRSVRRYVALDEQQVGGSALIDIFDRETVRRMGKERDWELIAAAGGKGAFRVYNQDAARPIIRQLVSKAHDIGVDIRFGLHDEYTEAAQSADKLYPYLPHKLDGHPCRHSGLYPSRRRPAWTSRP